MVTATGKLVEVYQLGQERAGVLDLPKNFHPQPGQFLPCQKNTGEPAILPTNLFQVIGPKGSLCVEPIPDGWHPGDELAYLPPQGHGFHLPDTARRIGLLTLGVSPARLLPLVAGAAAQDAALTLFCDPVPDSESLSWVPSAVEVAPLTALQDNLDWLDFLAVDLERKNLDELNSLLGSTHLPFPGQVLIQTAMPCRGLGACGVCSVKTHQGWRLACVDGPVFPLKELHHVAR